MHVLWLRATHIVLTEPSSNPAPSHCPQNCSESCQHANPIAALGISNLPRSYACLEWLRRMLCLASSFVRILLFTNPALSRKPAPQKKANAHILGITCSLLSFTRRP
ncbi:hypothetical protein HGRIS_013887 [Hohenbuehelia grisea]|uniref:Uncharacterized protein n=1 Tax=Hohenbuehelia grisea TaxID=104357 RepID=A0ABR3IWZ7_9AGAR